MSRPLDPENHPEFLLALMPPPNIEHIPDGDTRTLMHGFPLRIWGSIVMWAR